MEDLLLFVAILLVLAVAVLVGRAHLRKKAERRAEEDRRHRQEGQAKFERDKREAAALRERLSQADSPRTAWGQTYVANRERLKAEVPPPPKEQLYPGMAAIDFHRDVEPSRETA